MVYRAMRAGHVAVANYVTCSRFGYTSQVDSLMHAVKAATCMLCRLQCE